MFKIIKSIKNLVPMEIKIFIKKFRDFNAYNSLDKKMLKFINYKGGFYIDCGANDGVNQSTTWYYEKVLNWKGVLIEPIPKSFNQLKKNRNKNNFFFNCALVPNSFKYSKIQFSYNPNDTLTGKINNNFKKNKKYKTVNVKAAKLNDILNLTKTKKIDFFSLDVEGFELRVLKSINFKKYYIKYILVETNEPNIVNNFLLTKNFYLKKRLSNYKFLDRPHYGDYLFINKK